jgi:hypothetical protein
MGDALKHRIGSGLLTACGVGVMVGAGINVLVGGVAAVTSRAAFAGGQIA